MRFFPIVILYYISFYAHATYQIIPYLVREPIKHVSCIPSQAQTRSFPEELVPNLPGFLLQIIICDRFET